jgi:DNA processing protein
MGRPVFVVPGDVDRPSSVGCNMLIRDGAHPVLGSTDLIEELSLIVGKPAAPVSTTQGIPELGATVEELAGIWSVSVREALVRIGQLELEHQVKRAGDRVVPI